MNPVVETVSKETRLPIPRNYSVEASSRSAMDSPTYFPHGWNLGPASDDARLPHEEVLQRIDRVLASHAAALTVAGLPVHTVFRPSDDYDFDVLLKRSLDRTHLARPSRNLSITIHLTDPMTPTPELQPSESGAVREFNRAVGRLNYLRTLTDGWLGEGSLGASSAIGREAEHLLKKLHSEAPNSPLPVLGLDTDGTIVMSWSGNRLTGSMTIYGDGTYSYFVRRDGRAARDSEAKIYQPIAEPLKRLLEA